MQTATLIHRQVTAGILAAIAISSLAGGATYVPSAELTAYEQLMLELVNRARANPGAEAARLGIDLNKDLPAGTIQNTPKQPLAVHGKLLVAARGHSQWMLNADVFSHTGANNTTAQQRMANASYVFGGYNKPGENIAWGGNTVGTVDLLAHTMARHDDLFRSKYHREILCDGSFDEVGIGILTGVFTQTVNNITTHLNASMVTQDFAYSGATPGPLVTGVAYYDFNGNGFYDVGEGIRGATVNVSGAQYHTTTAGAGGYSVPLPDTPATRTVSFAGNGSLATKTVVFTADTPADAPQKVSKNHKVDFTPVYPLPVMTGSATPVAGLNNRYALPQDPFATNREVRVERWTAVVGDPASSLDRVTTATSSSYPALSPAILRSAPSAYHLAHTEPVDQYLTYKSEFEVGANAQLTFWSRLGIATPNQIAMVQVSKDGGATWTTVYSQAGVYQEGIADYGELGFNQRVASLASFAGKRVKLRFGYVMRGPWVPGIDESGWWCFGWYVDDLAFTNVREVTPVSVHTIPANADFYFRPATQGSYSLYAKSLHYDRVWPQGPVLEVTAGPETATLATWAAKQEDALGLAPGTLLSNLAGDYKGNGVPIVLARALGLNPVTATPAALPKMVRNGGFLDFNYRRDLNATEVILTPEIAVGAAGFNPLGAGVPIPYSDSITSTVGNIQYRRLRISHSVAPTVLVRLKATAN